MLVGDEEGVVVIPAERVAEIVEANLELERRDAFPLARIRDGVPLAGAYPLSATLRAEYERRGA